jgi:cytochrome P450
VPFAEREPGSERTTPPVSGKDEAMGSVDELIERFDVTDPEFVSWPYPVLDALREATPIFRNPNTGQWMITRFADVHECLRDRRLGEGYTHRYSHAEFGRPEPDPRWARFHEHERWSLLSIEPPDHTRLRRLVSKVFTPRAVEAMRPDVERFASEFLHPCIERGHFDLIADYAQPYSVAVICSMLGVPRVDTQLLLDWSHTIVKRRTPDGSLVSELAAVEDAGDTLSESEIVSTVMVLLEAGHEATVNTLGNGMRAMMLHRDQWQRVTSGAVAPRTAIEEMIRWDAPLHLFGRWVLDRVEIAGQKIAVGDEIAMLFGSANRDPRRFDDPGRFDVGRGDTAHIGFGGGIHFCIGAPLARLELETSLALFARRMAHAELAAEPVYHPTFVIRGLTALELWAQPGA